MEIVKKTEGNKATLEISGWLDTQTAPQLQEDFQNLRIALQASCLTLQSLNIFLQQDCVR